MKRIKHHKIKREKAESSLQNRALEEHDLAYYIHDRVELMHQVFSLLKYKELKAMAPESVRNLTIGDLEELCTEELLGISSKRLLAILDGVEPPSDTESSSPSPTPELETISLDSISSDEELLSSSKKKKHKHHRHRSKSKSKKRDKSEKSNKSENSKETAAPVDENSELSKASRAGLTVLELLELQARARAIRAQLQKEQANKRPSETTVAESSHHSSDNEVEIKEERPEVVEISSEDEKPDVEKLKKNIVEKSVTQKEPPKEPEVHPNTQKVTKRINDLIITVPQAATRKIKLNRNKSVTTSKNVTTTPDTFTVNNKSQESASGVNNSKPTQEKPTENRPKKKKKDKKKKTVEKDGSDHDEITLQLSDSEKMDLLENLDESRKNYDKVTSSSEDSESSSSESDDESVTKSNNMFQNSLEAPLMKKKDDETDNALQSSPVKTTPLVDKPKETIDEITSSPPNETSEELVSTESVKENSKSEAPLNTLPVIQVHINIANNCKSPTAENTEKNSTNDNENIDILVTPDQQPSDNNEKLNTSHGENKDHNSEIEVTNSSTNAVPATYKSLQVTTISKATRSVTVVDKPVVEDVSSSEHDTLQPKVNEHSGKIIEINTIEDIPVLNEKAAKSPDKECHTGSDKNDNSPKGSEQNLSDGELSDRQSSEIEAVDVQPEVVCISDEDSPKKKSEKKKKKKEKKAKKEKKSKKSKSDFRESSDQNFYKDAHLLLDCNKQNNAKSPVKEATPQNTFEDKPIDLDSDDVYEIFELSDDSSCYEVEGTVLSKEPTTEEIEALSARIDEIEREEVVTEEQIRHHEEILAANKIQEEPCEQNDENADNISWKDRYLDSKKVKKVLITANILNALRKKNKELKKKIQDSKKKEEEEKQVVAEETATPLEDVPLEEGSIEHYNTLQGSTKYVDPVKEQDNQDFDQNKSDDKDLTEKLGNANPNKEINVTKEMKKDARQLLKMYRKLLKYNDMNKQKDPNKKKKKKLKKDRSISVNNVLETQT